MLSADVFDYSRHMARDEEATVQAVGELRRRVTTEVPRFNGRLVDFTGDNFLAEFKTPLDAARLALHMQESPGTLAIRIGLHLGEVRDSDGLLFGDTVNIAARIQGLAEPGQVCVSAGVLSLIQDQLTLKVENLGTPALKNLPQRVQVYQIATATTERAAAEPRIDAGVMRRVAVLPFETLTRNEEDEVLADGMTEDVISLLSRLPGFHVISRTSTFAYKGRSQDVRLAAERFGVRYVVSGSVRRAGVRVRITAQLVDAETGTQLWAERYDRTIEDLFVVQDEVTRSIAAQLMPELTAAEGARAALEAPGNLDAWSYYQRALAERLRPGTAAGLDETQNFLEKAIEADPEFAPAISFLCNALATRNVFGWAEDPKENKRKALELSRRAAELAPHHPTVLHDRGVALAALGQVADGESLLLRSVDLNPSNAHGWAILGYIAVRMNRPQICIERVQRAISLSPRDPRLYLWDAYIASAYFVLGQDAQTLLHAERSTRAFEGVDIAWIYRAVSLAALGRHEEALSAAARYREMWPNTTLSGLDSHLARVGPSVETVRASLLSRFWALFEQTATPLDTPVRPSDADR